MHGRDSGKLFSLGQGREFRSEFSTECLLRPWRHLTQEQRRDLIRQELKERPQVSDRQIAKELGVGNQAVSHARNKMVADGELCDSHTSLGADGKEYPRKAERPITVMADTQGDAAKKAARLEPIINESPELHLTANLQLGAYLEQLSKIAGARGTGSNQYQKVELQLATPAKTYADLGIEKTEAAKIHLAASLRMGEFLKNGLEKATGTLKQGSVLPQQHNVTAGKPQTYSDLGIDRMDASRLQRLWYYERETQAPIPLSWHR